MFLLIGALIGLNLCVRIVLGEARQRGLSGRVGVRGDSRLTLEDLASIAWRGLLFLAVPIAIGLLLDNLFGTGFGEIVSS
jgi:hypothetical protein